MLDFFRYDFDYAWPWTYGHLIAAAVFVVLAVLTRLLGWARWTTVALGLFAAWGMIAAFIIHGPLRFTRPLELPTERFLSSGAGRVLDAGAGSGRSALMVLSSRPGAQVVALDRYAGYYGIVDNTPDRLHANARAAGVDGRLEATVGDMRKMPFGDNSFDAAVSAYTIDHLRTDDVDRTFVEVARVLRPGGEFLLMVINPDAWVRVALPFLHGHGYFGRPSAPDRWRAQLTAAGLSVVEAGTRPATLYFLTEKRSVRLQADR